jgi:hypothetical protein
MEILILLVETEEDIDYHYYYKNFLLINVLAIRKYLHIHYYKNETEMGHRMVFAVHNLFCKEIYQAKLVLLKGQSNAPT